MVIRPIQVSAVVREIPSLLSFGDPGFCSHQCAVIETFVFINVQFEGDDSWPILYTRDYKVINCLSLFEHII